MQEKVGEERISEIKKKTKRERKIEERVKKPKTPPQPKLRFMVGEKSVIKEATLA